MTIKPNDNFESSLSQLTKTSGSSFKEGWKGGDFFVEKNDEFIVVNNIAVNIKNKVQVIKTDDIIKIINITDKNYIFKWKGDKYRVNKEEFKNISYKLRNKE